MYSDTPHLYGNALSSVNVLRVGEKVKEGEEKVSAATGGVEENDGEKALEEGGEGEGVEWRKERDVPEGADARKKWFLQQERKEGWEWEEGRVYQGDFFNPYLDFNGGFHSRSRSGKDESGGNWLRCLLILMVWVQSLPSSYRAFRCQYYRF